MGQRRSGILLHPTSLPGRHGIGEMGQEALRFVDFLGATRQSIWQVLPLGPTGYGDSPYQCFSAFAGNPLLVSLDVLAEDGLLAARDLGGASFPTDTVDYGAVIDFKRPLLVKAFGAFQHKAKPSRRDAFLAFCRDEAALAAYLKEGPVQIVLPRRDHGISGRVRLHLQRSQPQWPDLERTAQALAMSAATLQRHLAAESTSFQALKDQLRREIAIYRLHTSGVPLAKLAAELGFADSSSFQHAFKSWTGSPPGRYRRSSG